MKFLGLFSKKQDPVFDAVVVRSVEPTSTPVSQIPSIKPAMLNYSQQFAGGRALFIAGEYDLAEIGKIEDTDAFVRQAFKKKEGLMFKEGIGLEGADKKTIKYCKTRMAQIARATGIPQVFLLKRIARSLIRTSNAFLIKKRIAKASGGRIRTTADGKTLQPIAGYFPVAPETMRADMDQKTGEIKGWRQILPDGRWKDYKTADVVHFVIDRREGFLFGVPTIIPVIDDIRALRQIEENVEMLLYQYLFPLFHYKVGTETAPAGYTENNELEVDLVKSEVELMPSEGALVTPERHEIKAIGAEGRALRAESYLEHFKKRVFAGLGVSQVDMGDGDTTNRATAQTLSRALIDAVKAIQDDLEAQWDHHVISELLLESTFGDLVLEDENMVHLRFAEIDIANKMEIEKHNMELFEGNGLTFDEFRSSLSREPIPLPEDPEDQDMSKYPEWSQLHHKLFEEPLTLMRAVDEPYSAAAQAAAQARSSSITQKGLGEAAEAKKKENQAAAEEDRKTKVAVAKNKAVTKAVKDHLLGENFQQLEEDTVVRLKSGIWSRNIVDQEYMMSTARAWAADTVDKTLTLAVSEMIRGFNDQTRGQSADAELALSAGRTVLFDRVNHYVTRLAEDTIRLISRRIDEHLGDVKLAEAIPDAEEQLHIAFDAARYRTNFIWDVELRKAHAFGILLGARFMDDYGIQLVSADDCCDRCLSQDGHIVTVDAATIDDMPPFHANSRMRFKVLRQDPNLDEG